MFALEGPASRYTLRPLIDQIPPLELLSEYSHRDGTASGMFARTLFEFIHRTVQIVPTTVAAPPGPPNRRASSPYSTFQVVGECDQTKTGP